jgi:hypothetical protein
MGERGGHPHNPSDVKGKVEEMSGFLQSRKIPSGFLEGATKEHEKNPTGFFDETGTAPAFIKMHIQSDY